MAKLVCKELNRLNANMYNNTKKFFEHNIPFSFNNLLEDDYFEVFIKTEQYKNNIKDYVDYKAIKMIVKELDNGGLING